MMDSQHTITSPKQTIFGGKILPRPHFRADIEGLRAIAILLVIGYHAHVPGFTGGYIGVDIFYVLSGYLITWLLVYEAQETGAIDLIGFHSRRTCRLLPAVGVVIQPYRSENS
jgi:peptidoglycan/LPS O-acetylase OafA/YrhL